MSSMHAAAVVLSDTGGPLVSDDDEDDFFDAVDEHTEEFKVCLPPPAKKSHM